MSDELESMSVEQLESVVQNESQSAPVEQATETPSNETNAPETAEEAMPKWFTDYKTEMKRELGSFRSLASLKDQMPQMIKEQFRQLQQAQQNANLSPEDQQAQAQLQAQQSDWAKFVREQAKAEFGEAAKDYLPVLQELIEKRQDDGHRNTVLDMAKDILPEEGDRAKAWESVFEQSYKDIQAGKPDALERQERLEKDPSFVALQMIQLHRQQVQTSANKVTQNRTDSAKAAAQTVRSGGISSQGKKSVQDMSEKELDGMSIADLEAALPE